MIYYDNRMLWKCYMIISMDAEMLTTWDARRFFYQQNQQIGQNKHET